jgi:hypothetical protein
MGPCLVVSHGNSLHSKQSLTPLLYAQLQIWQNLFSLATQPTAPFGHVPLIILGHFSQAIPLTFSLLEAGYASSYLCLEFVQFCC